MGYHPALAEELISALETSELANGHALLLVQIHDEQQQIMLGHGEATRLRQGLVALNGLMALRDVLDVLS